MAMTTNHPAEATGEFETPPTDAALVQQRKEVSWSATPKENAQETIEKRKNPIKYTVIATLSVKVVLKDTLTMFKKTDPGFLLVSKEDSTVTLQTAADVDKIPNDQFPKLFPAEILNGKVFMSMYSVSIMGIHRLKRATFGFYEYASRKLWINEDPFLSNDIRNIGFLIRKDPRKLSRDLLTATLYERLSKFPFDDEISQHFHEAREALPFQGPIPTFKLSNSENIWHSNTAGKVKTNALTIHCDQKHVEFLTRLFIIFYENGNHDEQFVPHSLLHGDDPTNLRAYRNAIVRQNQYLAQVRVLPVIGISPKALKEMIKLGDQEPETVLSLLNRYSHFSSIEITPQSEKLGKYLFMTTADKFEKGKQFIQHSLPQIWAKLDNTFLDELPAMVKCPRLTTSNLKDASTKKTAALLSAYRVPDDETIASHWSKPPSTRRHPPPAVTVNYSQQDFPAMVSTQPKQRKPKQGQQAQQSAPLESASVHSVVSATSAGTTFTKEDGQSLFTSLTESFMDDMKAQNAAVMETHKNMMKLMQQQSERDQLLRAEQAADNALLRAEQAKQATRTDERFESMLKAFMNHSTANTEPTTKEHKSKRHSKSQTSSHRHKQTQQTEKATTRIQRSNMDIEHDASPETDPIHRPMETSEPENQTQGNEASSSSSSSSSSGTSTSSTTYNRYNHNGRRRSETSNPDTDRDTKMPITIRAHTKIPKAMHSMSALSHERYYEYHNMPTMSKPNTNIKQPVHGNRQQEPLDDKMTSEIYEGGKGTDDENEWIDDSKPKPTSQIDDEPSIATVMPDDPESQSVSTVEPDDQDDDPHNTQDPSLDDIIYSPPRLDRIAPHTYSKTAPTTVHPTTTGDLSDAKTLSALQQRMRDDARRYETSDSDNQIQQQHSPRTPTSRDKDKHQQQDPSHWKVVSSSKRKAKDSPAQKSALSIRKTAVLRSSKKQILSARDLALGDAGQE
jgi:hypothetical protein